MILTNTQGLESFCISAKRLSAESANPINLLSRLGMIRQRFADFFLGMLKALIPFEMSIAELYMI